MTWQPMETAPYDGTPVWITISIGGIRDVRIARRYSEDGYWYFVGDDDGAKTRDAIAWMPLPAPFDGDPATLKAAAVSDAAAAAAYAARQRARQRARIEILDLWIEDAARKGGG